MLKNYLVTALRNIRKNRLTSFITILGFSIGIAGALLIFLYVQYELSFDRYLAGHDRIYRILVRATTNEGAEFESAAVSSELKNPLLSQGGEGIGGLTQTHRVDATLGFDNRYFFEQDAVYITDSSFLKVFSYPLLSGDRNTALERPMSVVLTPDKAKKYFGDENPIGKTLSYTSSLLGGKVYRFTVTGILAPLPPNSSFRFSFLMNCPFDKLFADILEYYNRAYGTDSNKKNTTFEVETYVSLRSNAFLYQFKRDLREALGMIPPGAMQFTYKSYQLAYESLDSIYLFSKVDSPSERRGNFLFILLLIGLAIIVIVIACMNVVNLTTARAMTRAKEIGIRKALGASRYELRLQCLVESVLLSFISLWFAVVLVELLLPSFSSLIKRDLAIHYLGNPAYLVAIVGVTFLVGVLSGLYPAIYLSSFSVIHTLKGQRSPSSRRFREAMVIVQFVFSIGLFIASAVILREFRSVRNSDSGFDSKDIVVARLNIPEVEARYPDMKKALSSVPGVLGVAASSFAAWKDGDIVRDFPITIASKMRFCDIIVVDPDYLRIQGIDIVQGRQVNPDYEDPYLGEYVINEAAQKQFGLGPGSFISLSYFRGKIVGVAKDFSYLFPSRKVKPLILVARSPFLTNNSFAPKPIHISYALIKLRPEDQERTLQMIEAAWKGFTHGYSFEYRYMKQELRDQLDEYYYSFEGILDISTILSFLLSGLGLFGLASFEVERRTKEVGIRKALGATSAQIVLHFLVGFSKLIGLANVVAWPLTFVLIRVVFTLIQYPRALSIGPLVFLEAGFVSLLVMIATVGAQTLRAARANPANTIRYE
jgi:putative ABC transport system permease protein